MPRPSRLDQQRRELIPIVTQVFSERGYRRATTAELARRCGVQENILYRLWRDKKAMFLAALDDIFQRRAEAWQRVVEGAGDRRSAVERLIAYEAEHQGEFGFYRVVFTALTEGDDAEIHQALVRMYRRFHERIAEVISPAAPAAVADGLPADDAAWGLIGLATVANVIRELDLLKPRQRAQLFFAVARHLVNRSL